MTLADEKKFYDKIFTGSLSWSLRERLPGVSLWVLAKKGGNKDDEYNKTRTGHYWPNTSRYGVNPNIQKILAFLIRWVIPDVGIATPIR